MITCVVVVAVVMMKMIRMGMRRNHKWDIKSTSPAKSKFKDKRMHTVRWWWTESGNLQ